jgi:glucose/mannose-6-phosphate isomerase
MHILDNAIQIKKINGSPVAISIANFPEQLASSWRGAGEAKLPASYRHFNQIIFCGMGGSNLASELIRSVYAEELKTPVILVRDYHLPAFTDKNTLVFVCSYSGGTEEPLSCLREAKLKKAKIFCLASGGELIAQAKKNHYPYYQFSTESNPSDQPRYGLGLQLGSLLNLLTRLKVLKVTNQKIANIADYLEKLGSHFDPKSILSKNPAKQLANNLEGSFALIIAAESLSANAHILSNQLNESAKNFALWHLIPELNHHLLEGLAEPKEFKKQAIALFLTSVNYSTRIQKRFAVTDKVLQKQKIKLCEYQTTNKDPLTAALEILTLGSWLSLYLSVLNKQNPAKIPWVNLFKEELAK